MEKETKYYFITYKPQDTRYMAYNAVIEGTPMEFVEEYRNSVILFAMEINNY